MIYCLMIICNFYQPDRKDHISTCQFDITISIIINFFRLHIRHQYTNRISCVNLMHQQFYLFRQQDVLP